MRYKIYNEDVFGFLSRIKSNSIDLIYTDPPYYIAKEASVIRRSNEMKYKGKDLELNADWDINQWSNKKDFIKWMKKVLKEFVRVVKDEGHIVFWVDKIDLSLYNYFMEDMGCKVRTLLAWKKSNPVPQALKVSPSKALEIACWFTKGKVRVKKYNWEIGLSQDVIECPIPNKQDALFRHPTQKPLYLVTKHILMLSKPKMTVLDPFCGVGTSGVACMLTKRRWIGNDFTPKYYKEAKRRIDFALKYRNLGDYELFNNLIKQLYFEYLKTKPKSVPIGKFFQLLGFPKKFRYLIKRLL